MSQLTDFGENKFADYLRLQGLPLPVPDWYIGLLTTVSPISDSNIVEVSGTDYARVAVPRTLVKWAGTQGPSTTLASNGTAHSTSNNDTITFPTVGAGGWTDMTHVGFFDAATAGNCWIWVPVTSKVLNQGDIVSILSGTLTLSLGLTGGMTDYLANALIDWVFRGQPYPYPTTYLQLFTNNPSNLGGGSEVLAPSYSRPLLVSSLAALSGTQGTATTVASSGTSGRISNNTEIVFPSPLTDWGFVTAFGIQDAAVGGNLLWWKQLPTIISVGAGSTAPTFAINSLGFTFA